MRKSLRLQLVGLYASETLALPRGENMSTENEKLVTDFCNTLGSGDMNKVISYLSEDVFYHNMPWAPVTGHAGVHEVLDAFVGANLLQKMEIRHTSSSGNIVTMISEQCPAIASSTELSTTSQTR